MYLPVPQLAADGTSYLFERNELVCFHTKLHFADDILGVGLNLENKLNGKLAYITTTFDLVSYQAFSVEKVRRIALLRRRANDCVPLDSQGELQGALHALAATVH